MLAALSVNKGCCSHQATAANPVSPEGTQDGDKQAACLHAMATAAAPRGAPWGDSGWERTGHGPQAAKVLTKGMISMSPDSCVFHTQKSAKCTNLRCLVFFSSNLLKFQLPGPCGETSCASWLLPYLFGAVPQSYLTGHAWGLSPQFCPQNKTQFSTFRLCIVFFSQWPLTPHRNGRQIPVSVSHVVLSTTLCAHTDCAC